MTVLARSGPPAAHSPGVKPSGRYRVTTIAEKIGWDGKLTDWLFDHTRDCSRKQSPVLSDLCGARCPDLPKVV
jgi:hypothetical protein